MFPEENFAQAPLTLFKKWYQENLETENPQPQSFVLATASKQGLPNARILLFKGLHGNLFSFFTNYDSTKGQELTEVPYATMVFYWPLLEKQIRISGPVKKMERKESENYFHSRPRGAQLGAHISSQGKVIPMDTNLAQLKKDLETNFQGQTVPCPNYWGGYLLDPEKYEFWISGPDRLHFRIKFTRSISGADEWIRERLAP